MCYINVVFILYVYMCMYIIADGDEREREIRGKSFEGYLFVECLWGPLRLWGVDTWRKWRAGGRFIVVVVAVNCNWVIIWLSVRWINLLVLIWLTYSTCSNYVIPSTVLFFIFGGYDRKRMVRLSYFFLNVD